MKKKDKKILIREVMSGTLRSVENAVKKYQLELFDKSYFDYDLLQAALNRGHITITKFLLKKIGCRVQKPNEIKVKEETPLHNAVKLNDKSIVKLILEKGASIYDVNCEDNTAIYVGFEQECFSAVDTILNYCCSFKILNPKNKDDIIYLYIGCIRNHIDTVKLYISSGFDVNCPLNLDSKFYYTFLSRLLIPPNIAPNITLLNFAVMHGCSENIIKLLIENGANCNKRDEEWKTPLHYACLCNYRNYKWTKIIKILLDYNSCPVVADERGCTPVHTTFCYSNYKEKSVFDMFISKISSEVNVTNDEGLSLYHMACTTDNISLVNDFLNSGVDIDSCVISGMYAGYTALHFAVLHNQKEVVKILLEKNAQINIKTEKFQVTPLHLACEFNDMKFMEKNSENNLEISEPFPVNINSTFNRKNQFDIIELLILYGADLDEKDFQGLTPLLHACTIDKKYNHLQETYLHLLERAEFSNEISTRLKRMVEIFLCNKADVNARSNTLETILHIISKFSFLQISEYVIKIILIQGADIDAVDDAGLTPLHVAVKANNLNMVKNLLKYKANVNIKCKNSSIPLHLAYIEVGMRHYKHDIIFLTLLENGSDVNIKDRDDQLLLHDAIWDENELVIEQLLNYGADINIEDSCGNSSISSLCLWYTDESESDEESDLDDDDNFNISFVNTLNIIFTHVQKLLALGLHVSEKIKDQISQLYIRHKDIFLEEYFINLDNIFPDCLKELERMKLIKMDNYTTLYSILVKDPHELVKYVRNKNLIKTIIAENLNEDFPFYSYLLKLQLKKGLIRSDLLQSAEASLCNVINKDLPYLCCYLVLKHLRNEDIVNLKKAAPLRALKRKLSDNNFNHPETSSCKRKLSKRK